MGRNRLVVAATAATTALAATLTLTAGVASAGPAGTSAPPDTARAVTPAPGTDAATVERAAAAPSITWGRCRDRVLRGAGARCGFLTVPLDHAQPSGRTLRIAVSRVRHKTRTSQGVMLVNPGGPGASGLVGAVFGETMPRRSGAGYDWIGFDPRGVGASKPALSCRPRYFHGDRPAYVPSSKRLLHTWLRRSEEYAKSCAKHGDLLDHMRTVDTARDMDLIRQALGAEQISYYGYSYGTYLGQVYATLFPSRVKRMVLDSNVDPAKSPQQAGTEQTLALERVFRIYFAWVARHRATYRLGRSAAAVERLYLRQRRVLQRRAGGGLLGPSEWDDAFSLAGYAQVYWPELTRRFALWVHRRNPRPLIQVWRIVDTPGDDNQYAAFLATLCTDAPSPRDWRTVVGESARLYRRAPVVTWASTWFSAPCISWPAPAGTPVQVRGGDTSVLLFGQTLDGATPFEDSLAVRSIFPGSRLVAIRGGTTHASTPDMSGRCANARLAAYLRSGALPARKSGSRPDVTCPAPPPPRP